MNIEYILLFVFISFIKSIHSRTGSEIPPDISTCSLNICSQRGGFCSTANITTGFECNLDDRCLNGMCVEGLKENDECEKSEDCGFGLLCIPSTLSNGTSIKNCEKAFYLDYGDVCNKTIECTHSLDCINNKCSTPLIGCFSDLQCADDEICVNGKCEQYILKENECYVFKSLSCRKLNQSCVLTSSNISSIGMCVSNVPEGTPCLTSKYSCMWNLGQYCQPLYKGSALGNCTKLGLNSFNTCTGKNDCLDMEYCKCDVDSGIGYCVKLGTFIGIYCHEASKLYIECFVKSNCTQPFSGNPYSCVRTSCKEESQCYSSACSINLLPFDLCQDLKCNLPLFSNVTLDDIYISYAPPNSIMLKCYLNSNVFNFLFILLYIHWWYNI